MFRNGFPSLPAGNVPQQSKELPSVELIANSLGTVPERQLQLIKQVIIKPKQNPDDADWAKKYNRPNFSSVASAGGGNLTFYPMDSVNATSQAYIDSTTIHETGYLLSR